MITEQIDAELEEEVWIADFSLAGPTFFIGCTLCELENHCFHLGPTFLPRLCELENYTIFALHFYRRWQDTLLMPLEHSQ